MAYRGADGVAAPCGLAAGPNLHDGRRRGPAYVGSVLQVGDAIALDLANVRALYLRYYRRCVLTNHEVRNGALLRYPSVALGRPLLILQQRQDGTVLVLIRAA